MSAISSLAGGRRPGPVGAGRIDEALSRIGACIASRMDLLDVGQAVAEAVQLALDVEAVSLLVLDGDALEFVGATGPTANRLLRGRLALDSDSLPTRTLVEGGPARIASGHGGPAWVTKAHQAAGFGVRSMIACPLIVDGTPRGVLQVLNPRDEQQFSTADVGALERLAPFAGAALSQALLSGELQRTQETLSRQNLILERRVAESTLLLSAATKEWELTFDAIADPLAIIEDGVLRRTNLAYAKAARRDIRSLPGLTCHEARFRSHGPCAGCLVAQGGGGPAEAEIHHDDGIFVRRAYRLGDGRPNAWVVSYQDVTEARRLEIRLKEAEHQSAIARVAAGAAHEINNPMAILTSSLRMLHQYVTELGELASLGSNAARHQAQDHVIEVEKRLSELAARAELLGLPHLIEDADLVLKEGEEGARRITSIVRALEVLGKQHQGPPEEFALLSVVEVAVLRARQAVPFPGRVRWNEPENPHLQGQPIQLEQALYEVIRNAAQAIDPTEGTIDVFVHTAPGQAIVEILDDGPGITAEHRERLLEPFFTTRGIGTGVGLGLTVASGVARLHGGNLEIEARPFGGTLVRLILPLGPHRTLPIGDGIGS